MQQFYFSNRKLYPQIMQTIKDCRNRLDKVKGIWEATGKPEITDIIKPSVYMNDFSFNPLFQTAIELLNITACVSPLPLLKLNHTLQAMSLFHLTHFYGI